MPTWVRLPNSRQNVVTVVALTEDSGAAATVRRSRPACRPDREAPLDRLVFPAASTTRRVNVWMPRLSPLSVCPVALVHAPNAPPSSLQLRVTAVRSLVVNVNEVERA